MSKIEILEIEKMALELLLEQQGDIYCKTHDRGNLVLAEKTWKKYLQIKAMCEGKAREIYRAKCNGQYSKGSLL